jgi:hypothetical protein
MLHYHLILCIKYRHKVIDDTISNRLKEIFVKIAPAYNIMLEEWNHDIDHVHILFRGHPNTEMSKFINTYKSASSRIIKKEFSTIRQSLWKEMFWSQSFCLLTTGNATVDMIKQYIQSQGSKDGKQSNEVQSTSYLKAILFFTTSISAFIAAISALSLINSSRSDSVKGLGSIVFFFISGFLLLRPFFLFTRPL